MRRAAALLVLAPLAADATAQGPTLAERRADLIAAKREAAAAGARADRLLALAAAERDAAQRTAAEERGLALRVAASAAALVAAEQRAAIVDRLLATQRDGLATAQRPVARLLAGLQLLASQPAAVATAQPGSVDDLVHFRAVIGGALPVVRARTAAVRAALDRTRRLRAAEALAARALADGRARLEADRTALALAEARHRGRAQALGQGALSESERALAMGERARDLVDRMEEEGAGQAIAADLVALPGPVMRPLPPGKAPVPVAAPYRLVATGRLVVGFGEISDAGVRSRGLTFTVAPGAVVRAPAAGTLRFAGRFRGYGDIVILDHGDGWNSLVTGLGALAVRVGDRVGAGQVLGRAGIGEEPRVTLELRRRGRPVDIASLIG